MSSAVLSRAAKRGWTAAVIASLVACEGPAGPPGPRGEAGPPGTADGGVTVLDAGHLDAGGEASHDAQSEPFGGLRGAVRDRTGAQLASGRVVLVPAARVAALAQTPIDLTLAPSAAALATNDEPLEDVADGEGNDLASASVTEDGSYRFESVPEGSFFVLYLPDPRDQAHLPGGDPARTPRSAETLRGATLDLTVSGSPTSAARYVGSSPCLTCHGQHQSLGSAHALTVRVPGISSALQDVSNAPRIDEALEAFAQGATLFFYDCGKDRSPLPACAVKSSPPANADATALTMQLVRDPSLTTDRVGAYAVELHVPGETTSTRYPVALTIGGALSYQQYVVRLERADGKLEHFVLPISYQLAGNDDNGSYRDYRYAGYRVEDWFDLDTKRLREPPREQAFERQCAGCHSTGLTLFGNTREGYRASAVAERDGVFDLDGDGRKELLAVGCESCHGPGSEHLEGTRGQHIVSPQLLTPERQALICGACHGNVRGLDGALAPLDAEGHMPRPGERRSTFLRDHVTALEPASAFFDSGDSRLPHQQYTDFLRSKKYRSGELLATCSDCHDVHRKAGLSSDLKYDASDSQACTSCHNKQADLRAHALERVRSDHAYADERKTVSCTSCHMVKTATGGAHVTTLFDRSVPPAVTYVRGDRTSHRFAFVDRSRAAEQPVAATQSCAFCHVDFLPNNP